MTVDKLLSIARKEIGYKETPANSNKTKYGKWYGLDGNPWCMMFVQWCFDQAGDRSILPIKTASCGVFRNAAKAQNNWITSGYKPGDVVIFDFPNTGAVTDHVGIVESVSSSYVTTIEGNTSVTSNDNGGSVMRRQRKPSLIIGAFRPKYEVNTFTINKGDTVNFIGNKQYTSSYADGKAVSARPCLATVTIVTQGRTHPYHLTGQGVDGWVNAADISQAIDVIAQEVIDGKWGNGAARIEKLKAAGYDPTAVQARVNALLK